MSDFRFHDVVRDCISSSLYPNADNHIDFVEWRACYDGGASFREDYLEQYLGKEDAKAFKRRKDLTPIPTYAKKEINKVKNSLGQRLCDITRNGGSERWDDAVSGKNRGVDRRGRDMNGFLTKKILSELLVMGEVGVLVDAPLLENVVSRADVPKDFSPYLQRFERERYPILIEAHEGSPSDWSHVLLETEKKSFNLLTGKHECTKEWRYYWLEDDEISRFGKVNVAFLDDKAELNRPVVKTDLDVIPFVLFDIDASLMEDVCSHQIVLLNMISADSNYAIDANYSVLTRQRGNAGQEGTHLDGSDGDDVTKAGSARGMYYQKGYDRPGFISPSVEPINASLELRRELKQEIAELVSGAIASMADDGSVEAGLHFIGSCIQQAERRCWDHWIVFEENRPGQRKLPTVHYPDTWSLKSDEERVDEATKFLKLANVMGGQENKKKMQQHAADRMHRGKVSTVELSEIMKEIEDAPYSIADPEVIIKAKKEGLVSAETGSLALGFNSDESEKAEEDAAKKQAAVVQAQKDMSEAGQGNVEGQADRQSKETAKANDDSGRPETEDETD